MSQTLSTSSDFPSGNRVQKVLPVAGPNPVAQGGTQGFASALQTAAHQRNASSEKEKTVEKPAPASEETAAESAGIGTEHGNTVPVAEPESTSMESLTVHFNLADGPDPAQLEGDEIALMTPGFVLDGLESDADLLKVAPGMRGSKLEAEFELTRFQSSGLAVTEKFARPDSLAAQSEGETDGEVQLGRALNAAQEAKLANSAKPEPGIAPKVGTQNWGEAMAGRIAMMVNQQMSTARIHLNPAELGPIDVRVNLNSDQASVQFLSHSAQVRDALEQSIPRLREMLEQAGYALADSHVGDQPNQENREQRPGGEPVEEVVESETLIHEPQQIGLVDERV